MKPFQLLASRPLPMPHLDATVPAWGSGHLVAPHEIVLLPAVRRGNGYKHAVFWRGRCLGEFRDPEHAACRTLFAMGQRGRLAIRWGHTGTKGMMLDIEAAAGRTVSEGENGLSVRKWQPYTGRPDPE